MQLTLEKSYISGKPVRVDDLGGQLFGGEVQAHKFVITQYEAQSSAETIAITGSVSGTLMASTGATVPLTGSLEDGKAVVVLDEDCYKVPGRFVLTIFVTSGDVTLCIYCAVGNVLRTSTDTVVYPTESLPNLAQLVDQVQAAIDSFPADLTAIQAAIAANYEDLTYPITAGTYAWHAGTLYKAKTDISAAESWTAAHWETVHAANDLATDISQLKSAFLNLADGNKDSMLQAKYYNGYYNGTPEYTGTKSEGKTATWGVCVIPVPIGEKITISGFRAQGGTNSCWLNSSDPADVHSVAWQSSANNGEKTCVTAWLGVSDYNLLGNTNDIIVNFAMIDSINDRLSAEETLSKYIANKENLTPLYKADLVYGYFQADNGQYRSEATTAMVNNRMYQFPFDVVVKDVPEGLNGYRIITFSDIVPFSKASSVFLTSASYNRAVKTMVPANTIFCVSVHASSEITADAIDGMFIGWPDFDTLRNDVDGLIMEEMPLKADKTYVDGLVSDKASIEYVNQQITSVDAELAQKANLTDISTPYNFKGSCTFAELPATATVNDTWYVTDREYKMTWNGSGWYQSSLSEADYEQSLSKIDERLDYKDKQLFSTGAKPTCAVTFTDDDGHEEFYTIIRPICLAKNCKYTSAYVTGSANMTDAQLAQLQADGLFEFISHSHSHIPPDSRTDAELRADFAASVAWLKAHNMNYHGYAAPGGNTNARTRRIIKEYFDYNLSGFAGISNSPLYQFDIPRVTLFDPNTTFDLSTYTAWVDRIYDNGGWLVFIGHCWESEFDPTILSDLIDYIQAKGIEIISTEEGVERYGNLIDLGDHSLQNDELHEFLSVGVDGSVASSGGIILQNDKNVTVNTPITYFPNDKLTCLTIANGSSFPLSQGGVLCTMRISPLIKNGISTDINSFQIWCPYYEQAVFKRRWNSTSGAWGNWKRISGNYAGASSAINALQSKDLTAGAMFFNTTLNKPIWRNASNNGWVDATGAAVTLD